MNQSPTWIDEHGAEYDVPLEILHMEGIEDWSWHNDVCPSFGLYDSDSNAMLRIWVQHPDMEMRECFDHRFSVVFYETGDEGDEICITDDVMTAIRAFMETLPRYHAATRGKMTA